MASIYSAEYQSIIKALRETRIAKGITQESVAQTVNRPQSFIAKVENGERRLDVVEFIHIARLLALDPAKIIAKIPEKYNPLG